MIHGMVPTKAGQIIIRPRTLAQKTGGYDEDGKALPPPAPENVWVIEQVGSVLGTRHLGDREHTLTTNVMFLRDGDLQNRGGLLLP